MPYACTQPLLQPSNPLNISKVWSFWFFFLHFFGQSVFWELVVVVRGAIYSHIDYFVFRVNYTGHPFCFPSIVVIILNLETNIQYPWKAITIKFNFKLLKDPWYLGPIPGVSTIVSINSSQLFSLYLPPHLFSFSSLPILSHCPSPFSLYPTSLPHLIFSLLLFLHKLLVSICCIIYYIHPVTGKWTWYLR